MSAAVFRVDSDLVAHAVVGSELPLPPAAGRHAVSVLRVRPGEGVEVTDGRGWRAGAQVVSVSGRDACILRISEVMWEPEPMVRFVVAQALLKGDQAERAVDLLTQVGVDEIIPWRAERCVARWDGDRTARGEQRWADALAAAALQSRRARWPVLHPAADLAGLTTRIAEVRGSGGATLVLHEAADDGLMLEALPTRGDTLIVVGPEGGLTEHEVAALTSVGAHPTRLGTPVLRASSAGALAVAACSGQNRWRHDRIGP